MGQKSRDLLARLVWPLVVGSSLVVRLGQEAHKTYQPRILVRFLHLLALGSTTHLYQTELGLNLAFWRRLVLSAVLRAGSFDEICRVAQPLRVKKNLSGAILVTEWVEGNQPNPEAIWDLAERLVSSIFAAGLPTWSVSPVNPRFATNFVLDGDGILYIVDYESLLLSPLVSDWVNFDRLWLWYRQIAGEDEGIKNLIEKCQSVQNRVRRRLRWEFHLV